MLLVGANHNLCFGLGICSSQRVAAEIFPDINLHQPPPLLALCMKHLVPKSRTLKISISIILRDDVVGAAESVRFLRHDRFASLMEAIFVVPSIVSVISNYRRSLYMSLCRACFVMLLLLHSPSLSFQFWSISR